MKPPEPPMVTCDAWVFPEGETHLPAWMEKEDRRVDGRLTYQYQKYEVARDLCLQRRTAVDIGAHVGLWSYWMALDFAVLHAFEPDAAHCACWERNVTAATAWLHPVALGATRGLIGLAPGEPGCSGNTHVSPNGVPVTVPLTTLDSFDLQDVDFIKIDCEGYEYFVLLGALETIRLWRPIVIVEQKHGCGPRYGRGEQDAVDLLVAEGAHVVANLGQDFVLTFRETAA